MKAIEITSCASFKITVLSKLYSQELQSSVPKCQTDVNGSADTVNLLDFNFTFLNSLCAPASSFSGQANDLPTCNFLSDTYAVMNAANTILIYAQKLVQKPKKVSSRFLWIFVAHCMSMKLFVFVEGIIKCFIYTNRMNYFVLECFLVVFQKNVVNVYGHQLQQRMLDLLCAGLSLGSYIV